MDVLAGYRKFRRFWDGILIWLRLEEWPSDVPLPAGTRVTQTGDGPFEPYWHFVLERDKTIEAVVGWFVVPLDFEETIAWYRTRMREMGWAVSSKEGYVMSEKALLRFEHPETRVRVEVSIQWWHYKEETTAMLRRVTEHPWSPPQVNGSDVKRRTGTARKKSPRQAKPRRRVAV